MKFSHEISGFSTKIHLGRVWTVGVYVRKRVEANA
jgi:hypothetical protein